MKNKLLTMILVGLFIAFGAVDSAMAISFDPPEINQNTGVPVALFDTDPLIDNVQFFAGDPLAVPLPNDTYVDDWWTPGDQYLMSGYDDGTGSSPGSYDTFIGASAQGFLFESVSIDIALDYTLPGGTNLWVAALSGGSQVDTASFYTEDADYHNLTVSYASCFDTIHIWDDLDSFSIAETFHIDNFEFTECGAAPIPEPATMLLLGTGLAGLAAVRRRRARKS